MWPSCTTATPEPAHLAGAAQLILHLCAALGQGYQQGLQQVLKACWGLELGVHEMEGGRDLKRHSQSHFLFSFPFSVLSPSRDFRQSIHQGVGSELTAISVYVVNPTCPCPILLWTILESDSSGRCVSKAPCLPKWKDGTPWRAGGGGASPSSLCFNCRLWWCTPYITAFGRLRQEYRHKIKACLNCRDPAPLLPLPSKA